MDVVVDAPGSERSHGYTYDGDWHWYWVHDHADAEVSFRTTGTPQAHPIRNGEVPEEVREATEQWVEKHEAPGGGLR